MASMVLSLAGAAAGEAVGGAFGAMAGRLVGSVAGSLIDKALSGGKGRDGARLKSLDVMTSTEGSAVPRVYGRVRIAGEVIWATRIEEVASGSGGGKGLGGGGGGTSYSYFANIAVGLCEGPIACIGRVWADGDELDQTDIEMRVHRGTETQDADPLIVAKQGDVGAPAYRGLAYVVFERLPLADFGNRIPQLSFEVIRPVGALENNVRALVVIPGATEFGYDPRALIRDFGFGEAAAETAHTTRGVGDFTASLDEAQAICPKLERVALTVAWFGDDLRVGQCRPRPCVERRDKVVSDAHWAVAGETRASARLVSWIDDRPAYGGTPSDASVVAAIRDLKARGLKVTLLPFLMMDVPPDNGRPDPWTGAANQPPFPWRGRLTLSIAPGRPGSPDATAAAAAEVNAFLGAAAPSHFSVNGETVTYAGPAEWSYRRMILHMAHLAKAAGGVDAFLVGSEMVGLTRARSAAATYPFVQGLVALAAEVKAVLPGALITYAADWTEYGAHAIGADLRFPLDAFWASGAVGAVGIDWYAPLDDRRDDSAGSAYDRAVLRAGMRSGEAFDWFYASEADRLAGARSPIADGLGKPWIFRQKDLASWWSNAHVERVAGVETAPTAWTPRSKPIWFTEIGFPAVDRAANRPSVFPDAKSSEAGLPPFSAGGRDDLMQRRCLEAALSAIDPDWGASLADNPLSPVYGGRMIDQSAVHLWAWDARPWPAFPRATEVFADGQNWVTGHWLNGRFGAAPLSDLVRAVVAEHGGAPVDVDGVEGVLDGLALGETMSARDALDSLATAFLLRLHDRDDRLVFENGPAAPAFALVSDALVAGKTADLSITRAPDAELPRTVSIAFGDTDADFRSTAISARRLTGHDGSTVISIPGAADPGEMEARAEALLHALWAGRETQKLTLPPSALALEPGDVVTVATPSRTYRLRLTRLEGALSREAEAETATRPTRLRRSRARLRPYATPAADGRPAIRILDLPALDDADPPPLGFAAAAADPWRGAMTVWRGGVDGDEAIATLNQPSLMGATLSPLNPGPVGIFDRGAKLTVRLVCGALVSLPESRVLAGANACAVLTPAGAWEVLQFRDAALVGEKTYELAFLLRGQRGTEAVMAATPAGAPIVFLDGPLASLGAGLDLIGRPLRYRIGLSSRGPSAASVAEATATLGSTALLPYAPTALAARREAAGIRITWIRRTRRGGDGFDLVEVPLGETSERYRLTVMTPAGVVRRTVETTVSTFLYAATDEIADFGAPVAALRLAVEQCSESAGAGRRVEAILQP